VAKYISKAEKDEHDKHIIELWGQMPFNDFTQDGECSNCGFCCSDTLPLSVDDLELIKEFMKDNKLEPSKSRQEVYMDGKLASSPGCPFRNNETKRCNIYSHRPKICREYKCCIPKDEFDYQNADDLTRSLRQIFFDDDLNQRWMWENYEIKVFEEERIDNKTEKNNFTKKQKKKKKKK